jgi:hypothetical protein
MLASNRWTGSRGIWCATNACVLSFCFVSALSFRVSVPGREASGQVWPIAINANNRRLASLAFGSRTIVTGRQYLTRLADPGLTPRSTPSGHWLAAIVHSDRAERQIIRKMGQSFHDAHGIVRGTTGL